MNTHTIKVWDWVSCTLQRRVDPVLFNVLMKLTVLVLNEVHRLSMREPPHLRSNYWTHQIPQTYRAGIQLNALLHTQIFFTCNTRRSQNCHKERVQSHKLRSIDAEIRNTTKSSCSRNRNRRSLSQNSSIQASQLEQKRDIQVPNVSSRLVFSNSLPRTASAYPAALLSCRTLTLSSHFATKLTLQLSNAAHSIVVPVMLELYVPKNLSPLSTSPSFSSKL